MNDAELELQGKSDISIQENLDFPMGPLMFEQTQFPSVGDTEMPVKAIPCQKHPGSTDK